MAASKKAGYPQLNDQGSRGLETASLGLSIDYEDESVCLILRV